MLQLDGTNYRNERPGLFTQVVEQAKPEALAGLMGGYGSDSDDDDDASPVAPVPSVEGPPPQSKAEGAPSPSPTKVSRMPNIQR